MRINTTMIIKDSGGEFDFSMPSRDAYKIAREEEAEYVGLNTSQLINDIAIRVKKYNELFDSSFNEYMRKNSVIRKLQNSLTPNGNKRETVAISNKELHKNKTATMNFINTMDIGHSLLLQMRETLTGQKIKTRFFIEADNKIYQISEEEIENIEKGLSLYSGKTVSNPFSLAYELDIEVLRSTGVLREENLIFNDSFLPVDIYNDLLSIIKPEYLESKSKVTGREYPNVFFDSKDIEIIELLRQELERDGTCSIDVSKYQSLRKKMGGGGGYASPFYKIGDVGSVQVKFFKFKNNTKKATVNYARFSLLRDKFRYLETSLEQEDQTKIINDLLTFFTETDKNVLENEINSKFNEVAKENIMQWL